MYLLIVVSLSTMYLSRHWHQGVSYLCNILLSVENYQISTNESHFKRLVIYVNDSSFSEQNDSKKLQVCKQIDTFGKNLQDVYCITKNKCVRK
jgi:hypothetical protein